MNLAIFIFLAFALTNVDSQNPCEGLDLVFVNDPSSCSKYFSCVLGQAYQISCDNGWWFHKDPLGCHTPGTVPCERCPANGISSVGVEGSCTEYVMCINGNSIERECPEGTRFDPTQGRCDKQELVPCASSRCPIGTETTLEADPESCRHYFICSMGQEIVRRSCNENLLFDPVLRSCALPGNVNCESRPLDRNLIPRVPTRFVGDIPTAPTVAPTTRAPAKA